MKNSNSKNSRLIPHVVMHPLPRVERSVLHHTCPNIAEQAIVTVVIYIMNKIIKICTLKTFRNIPDSDVQVLDYAKG